ncbi:MAG TPA: hypothetical protein PLF61_06190 [Candidatus Goldiibacteriota bacterium]|nr:hypothetical protein [Candidatus Goldiibacteriota bacterium]
MKRHDLFKNLTVFFISFFVIITGCDAKKSTKTLLKEKGLLCSFETVPSDTAIGDFDWETNGFVKLEQFKKYATNGKYSAQAIFSVPADFLPNTETAKIDQRISAMTLSISTLTRLKVTNWSEYKKFGVDVYVPDNKEREFFIKLIDNYGNQYITTKLIKNGRNKLEIALDEVKAARINTGAIVILSLYLNTKNEEKDVTLYIDNVHLTP